MVSPEKHSLLIKGLLVALSLTSALFVVSLIGFVENFSSSPPPSSSCNTSNSTSRKERSLIYLHTFNSHANKTLTSDALKNLLKEYEALDLKPMRLIKGLFLLTEQYEKSLLKFAEKDKRYIQEIFLQTHFLKKVVNLDLFVTFIGKPLINVYHKLYPTQNNGARVFDIQPKPPLSEEILTHVSVEQLRALLTGLTHDIRLITIHLEKYIFPTRANLLTHNNINFKQFISLIIRDQHLPAIVKTLITINFLNRIQCRIYPVLVRNTVALRASRVDECQAILFGTKNFFNLMENTSSESQFPLVTFSREALWILQPLKKERAPLADIIFVEVVRDALHNIHDQSTLFRNAKSLHGLVYQLFNSYCYHFMYSRATHALRDIHRWLEMYLNAVIYRIRQAVDTSGNQANNYDFIKTSTLNIFRPPSFFRLNDLFKQDLKLCLRFQDSFEQFSANDS